ncbi:hypothetical protein BRADI_5g03667v3 [Brachypodium distachyon]|uniref:Uncharacterized protein n=1 Tax=Brachypodium distachyon TaxID=15368 RepID=A0A2K2CFB7_BRADI|nr:hypothetical protein BRADI_5g03667v3 [Brachypodium distachyon]
MFKAKIWKRRDVTTIQGYMYPEIIRQHGIGACDWIVMTMNPDELTIDARLFGPDKVTAMQSIFCRRYNGLTDREKCLVEILMWSPGTCFSLDAMEFICGAYPCGGPTSHVSMGPQVGAGGYGTVGYSITSV